MNNMKIKKVQCTALLWDYGTSENKSMYIIACYRFLHAIKILHTIEEKSIESEASIF